MATYYQIDLGVMPYREARLVQALAQKAVLSRGLGGIVLTCQHPAVITFGKNSADHHLKATEAELGAADIALVSTDRGGEVTGHNLGQLVAYPILHLPGLKMMAKSYIHALEQTVIDLLTDYDITGKRDPDHPGIWVGEEKICAVGVRFSRRVSLHGLALNIANDLTLFDRMTPCGITGRGVTSIREWQKQFTPTAQASESTSGSPKAPASTSTAADPLVAEVRDKFVGAFSRTFDIVPVCLPLTSLLDQRIPHDPNGLRKT